MFRVKAHEARSIGWWYTQKDDIDLAPPYQRGGGLWGPAQQAYLIDSILNEYDIPKIYLADFTIFNSPLNASRTAYAVIDGRQRLEAIFAFRDDKFPLNDDFVLFSDPAMRLGGLSYSDLSSKQPKIADRFREFNLHVMSVITDDEAKINDLFVRLNSSKPLTGAEVRNAMTGLVPAIVRTLSEHPFFTECARFSAKRGEDKNATAKILLLEYRGKLVDTKKVQLDRFVEEGVRAENPDLERAGARVGIGLNQMRRVFGDKDVLLSSQGSVPLYYWFIRTFGSGPEVREFLEAFDLERRRNRRFAEANPNSADQQLLTFELLSRSVNDQASYVKRFEILVQKFIAFRKKSGKEPQQTAPPKS
ncbi:MAG: DUF262 domain-containing protein [Candidatus Brocadiia bacterium]